jgi:hypothetical protein
MRTRADTARHRRGRGSAPGVAEVNAGSNLAPEVVDRPTLLA